MRRSPLLRAVDAVVFAPPTSATRGLQRCVMLCLIDAALTGVRVGRRLMPH